MRLSKIKLAGFKSFVDPTTIHLLSNLTAVAGPNGCGKSNVIDAVRWVLGESSAKHMRAGALTDVIFSGSSARKPVGQATVELLFDNAEGKLGGEYAKYSEIAIKRQVTRDGQSNYFLNGQKCRRRDITDIFLGTGLGPRSYAIIEQGMISRVIDAKPEDLRIFIEEAAGISKYKERRRETENRIRHTQENLARLNDLRGELDSQIRHLQKQAQAAERYQILKSEEITYSAQLAALAWKRLDLEIKQHEAEIRDATTKLEGEHAGLQHQKTQLEIKRIAQTDANESLNEVQKHYYGIGAQIAKIEQAIFHHQERQQQLEADKDEAQTLLDTAQAQLEQDQATILNLQEKIEQQTPEYELKLAAKEQALEVQHQAEEALEMWRESMQTLQQATLEPTRLAESEKAKITQLEKQIHQTQERQARLDTELNQYQVADSADIAAFDEKIEIVQQAIESMMSSIEECTQKKEKLQNTQNQLRPQIKEIQQKLNAMQGQQVALTALQAAALGNEQHHKMNWLSEHGLNEKPYLAQSIDVQEGWELAVETVLGGFLEALGVEQGQLMPLTAHLSSLEGAGINLIEWQANNQRAMPEKCLAQVVKGAARLPQSIFQLLVNVKTSNSLEEATRMLSSLSEGETVITRQGEWLGQGWLKVKQKQADQESLLVREEKLKKLLQEIEISQERISQLQNELDESEELLLATRQEQEQKQQERNRLQQELVTLQSEQKIKQSRFEQSQKRLAQIQQDITECNEQIHHAQIEVNAARSNLHHALEKMAQFNQEQENLIQSKQRLHDDVNSARTRVKEAQAAEQQIALTLQTYRTQLESLTNNISRFKNQIENAMQRVSHISALLEKNEEPVFELKQELEVNLEKRITIEHDLNSARDKVAEIDLLLREIEQTINLHEQKIIAVREHLENSKMAWQALTVRCESAQEKIKNTEFTMEQLLEGLPEDASESVWQERLSEIETKISRLGAINLAAIEEYSASMQRKEYLDAQCNDLTEALTTLENAIKKIDKETKAKFKETFDTVNDSFMKLFPRLFGGGHASLIMEGDDLLDTGVLLTARPPGKKNSTIQQLSGGEKALTAVALVFSIFQLNPAPFCMLDEVDAPLDDNNVGRFCNLVKEMSKTIQFIYVSHNKLAIEMAEQLQGVTMREPGVSRLVTVDIEEAISHSS